MLSFTRPTHICLPFFPLLAHDQTMMMRPFAQRAVPWTMLRSQHARIPAPLIYDTDDRGRGAQIHPRQLEHPQRHCRLAGASSPKKPGSTVVLYGSPHAARRAWSALTRLGTREPCAVPAGGNGMWCGARATGTTRLPHQWANGPVTNLPGRYFRQHRTTPQCVS